MALSLHLSVQIRAQSHSNEATYGMLIDHFQKSMETILRNPSGENHARKIYFITNHVNGKDSKTIIEFLVSFYPQNYQIYGTTNRIAHIETQTSTVIVSATKKY
jgi:hypothetical protein